jgi:hypothetical protein
LLDDPGLKFLCEKLGKAGKKKKGAKKGKGEKRKETNVSERPSSTAEIR